MSTHKQQKENGTNSKEKMRRNPAPSMFGLPLFLLALSILCLGLAMIMSSRQVPLSKLGQMGIILKNEVDTVINMVQEFINQIGKPKHEVKSKPISKNNVKDSKSGRNVQFLSKEELSTFNGKNKKQMYLSVLGRVYDVTKGSKHYGPNGHYSFFTGKDASRSYVTGDFEGDLNDNIDDFDPGQSQSLQNWVDQYDSNKDYPFVGYLCGTFYSCPDASHFDPNKNLDSLVIPTDKLLAFGKKLAESRNIEKIREADRKKFPPCNSEWDANKGGRVWCSNRSGGIDRDWIGVPRLYLPEGTDKNSQRCACVRPELLKNPRIRLYPNCDKDSVSCPLPFEKK